MGKNKNKNKPVVTKPADTKVPDTKVEETTDKSTVTATKDTPKETPKADATPKGDDKSQSKAEKKAAAKTETKKETVKVTAPKADATPKGDTVDAPVSPEQAVRRAAGLPDGNIATMKNIATAMGFKENERVSPDAIITFLDVTDRYLQRSNPNSKVYAFTEKIFTTAHAYIAMKTYVQIVSDGGGFQLEAPAEIKDFLLEQFSGFGVALPESAITETPEGQMTIDFKDATVEEATVVEINREIESQARVAPELDPTKWKNDEDARKGLVYIISNDNLVAKNEALAKFIESVREYRKSLETSNEKKAQWDLIPAGALLTDGLVITKNSLFVTGIGSSCANFIRCQKLPFAGHCIIKKHLPTYSEKDIADVVVALIMAKAENEGVKFEEYNTYKLLTNPEMTRELCLDIAEQNAALTLSKLDSKDPENAETIRKIAGRVNVDRSINGLLYANYRNDLNVESLSDPTYPVKAANLLIRIANLYRTPDARFAEYEEKGYPASPSETEAESDKKEEASK